MSWASIPRGKGAARNSKKEFNQFLHVSLGSVSELETQVLISKRLGYVDREEALLCQIETVRKLLLGLIKYLRKETA